MSAQSQKTPSKLLSPSAPLWSVGFRPFFLLAAIASLILMFSWPMIYRGIISVPSVNLWSWHGHEMIFGYSMAIIAGFLLTAVRNWTGLATASGKALMLLSIIWLLPRLAPVFLLISSEIFWLQVIDLLFLPALILAVGVPIIKSKNWRNLAIVIMLTGFALLHLAYYLSQWQLIELTSKTVLLSALQLIMVLIALIGARVLPMFTANGTKNFIQQDNNIQPVSPKVYARAPWLLLGLGFFQLFAQLLPWTIVSTVACAALSLLILINLIGWQGKALWHTPLLWVIHIGYFGVALGFLLKAFSQLGFLPESVWVHTMALLAVGMMTLGFAGRVSLGHSGQPLLASKGMIASYLLMLAAALIRIFAALPQTPELLGKMPITALWDMAALCWALAMLLFVIKFLPLLTAAKD